MTEEQMIKTTLEDGIFTLTFNRPEAMNAMNQTFGNRVREALRLAVRDPEVRVLVVTGEGRGFSAGGDLKNLGQADPRDALAAKYGNDPRWNGLEMRHERLMESAHGWDQLRTMPKPTIAMVNGPAIGAGMVPALTCDFRVCSDAAYFNSGYANVGLSGDVGMTFHLINVVGPAKARELLFFPRKVEADEALRIGLVTKVVPHARLREETLAMARQLAQGPTLTLGHMKENITAALELSAGAYFDLEARNFVRCFETEDHKEAVKAFKEKRKPVFRGR
jgi:2-(1,2-epoxy-1,2-dihydrophenyl)acetyl-CoA isomerase